MDLTAIGDAIVRLGGNLGSINTLVPAELVIDHLMQVDQHGTLASLDHNVRIEMRWGCKASGKVMVMLSARAKRFVYSKTIAWVDTLQVQAESGSQTIAVIGHVILASGGISGDQKLIHRFAPQYAEAFFVGGKGNVCDGLLMACSLDAGWRIPRAPTTSTPLIR